MDHEQLTELVAHLLRSTGFGPNGFTGSLASLVAEIPGFPRRVRPTDELLDALLDFREVGVSLEGDWHQVNCSVAEKARELDMPLPPWLLDYLIDCAKNGPPKKPTGPDNRIRDALLVRAVRVVGEETQLPISRNDATEGPSGCTIVSDALERVGMSISAKRLAAICRDWRGLPLPLPLWRDPVPDICDKC
jgi:hypothetical protein